MTSWHQSLLALKLLETAGPSLGGIHLRARSGPARDAFLKRLPEATKLHPALGPQEIEDGIDLTATLESGVLERSQGLLTRSKGLMLLTMAERTERYLASKLMTALDHSEMTLVALDEGSSEDEMIPAGLADRLAFSINLDDTAISDTLTDLPQMPDVENDHVDDLEGLLVGIAVKMGIPSLRAPTLALRTAKAHARLFERDRVYLADVQAAVLLVLAPRATAIPDIAPEPPAPLEEPSKESKKTRENIPDDMIIQSVKAMLPSGTLDAIHTKNTGSVKGSGAGKKHVGNRRGRPLPAKNRQASSNARIDLIATLRSAVPWQTLRKYENPTRTGPIIKPADLRSRRYEEHSDRLLIFLVDASGSLATTRLGEAKGAVELLLADAYAKRDHVALVAFRNQGAELLLPPTRSLVQTKRRLASLPGGGGTPLASGLKEAFSLAITSRQKGLTPSIVLLTDGKANIALDGSSNREIAAEDAAKIAGAIRAKSIDTLLFDTGPRPSRQLAALGSKLGGKYMPLPRADAKKLSDTVSQTLRA